ncbi:MAG TPA: hypothetical protein VFE67_13555 [Rudaea sp.]|nr:hypothetical protein [Rudaea sp.]
MRPNLLLLCVALAAASPAAIAADATSDAQLQALDARIRALEADSQKLRDQAAAALAAADAARADLEKMKATMQASQQAAKEPTQQEHATQQAQTTAAVAAVAAPAEASAPNPGGANGNAFNPAIAVILNGNYAHHSLNPDNYVRAGFPIVDGGGPIVQGLSLGESEISFAANVDDKFYGQLSLSYEDNNGKTGVNIEEAYIDTLALPDGLSVRLGRFFSNIGYLNSHHTHTDNFVDRPLPYQAFLAGQYGDDGAQLRWVAPLDVFLEFGGELFRGENFPTAGANRGGVGTHTLFAHAGGDVGDENSWLAGVSMLDAKTTQADDGFSGDHKLYIADATWKWAPNGNTKDGGITLRSEYFLDQRDGTYSAPTADAIVLTAQAPADPLADPALTQPWIGDRRGVYVEAVYRLNRSWDMGYRFDKLWAANTGPYASDFDPVRHSLELTWRNSEFSFFRLQYSHDDPTRTTTDNALFLQYDVSLGAHGAHKF